MSKQVIPAFEINSCLVFCCTRFNCDNIHYYSTKTDEKATHGKVGASAGGPNEYSCTELHTDMHKQGKIKILNSLKVIHVAFQYAHMLGHVVLIFNHYNLL